MTELSESEDALVGSLEQDDLEAEGNAASLSKLFLRRLMEASWPFRGRLCLVVVLNVARAVCLGAVVYFISDVTSALLEGGERRMTRPLAFSIAALLILRTLSALAQFMAEEARRWFEEGVEITLLEGVLENLCRLPADYFETRSLPGLVVRLDKLQEMVRGFIGGVVTVFVSAAAVLGLLGGMVPTAPVLGVVSLIVVAVVSLLAWRRTEEYQELMRQEYHLDANLADMLGSMFKNPRDLHNYGLLESTLRGFDVRCAGLAARALRKIRLYTGIAVFLNVVVISFMTALTAGVVWWDLNAASAIACFAAVAMSLQPLSELVRSKTKLLNRVERMGKLLARTDELNESDAQVVRATLNGPIRVLRAKDLWYHRGKAPILHGLNFEVRTGEILGVIGRSGAGKTTLANVLLGLSQPSKGRLVVNKIDVDDLELSSLWKHSAYVTQLPCHSGGDTLVDEVALVRPDAPLAEIHAALEEAGVERELWNEPLVSEDWRRDAGMDWRTRSLEQRLEWARVILRGASLVVLDEPTSMVDEAQEDVFTESLRKRKAERITVLVSHRARTLSVCDRILVLQGGRQVALGPRDEILKEWLSRLSMRRSA